MQMRGQLHTPAGHQHILNLNAVTQG